MIKLHHLVTVINEGSRTYRVHFTVLPGRIEGLRVNVDHSVDIVPYDYGSVDADALARSNVFMYRVVDADGDGLMGLVGLQQANPADEAYEGLPPCATFRGDVNLRSLGAPGALVSPDKLFVGESLTLESYLRLYGLDPQLYLVPMWSYTLNPGEDLLLLVYVEAEDSDNPGALVRGLDSMVLALSGEYAGRYYYSDGVLLPSR